jgi:hypothetical protein
VQQERWSAPQWGCQSNSLARENIMRQAANLTTWATRSGGFRSVPARLLGRHTAGQALRSAATSVRVLGLLSRIASRLYDIVRARVTARFAKAMGLYDFRRAGPTFLAMDAPEKISLIPGLLQHASPETNEQHYNLARSIQAGQRFARHLPNARSRLRLLTNKFGMRPFRRWSARGENERDQHGG